jgi:hypothetical protein
MAIRRRPRPSDYAQAYSLSGRRRSGHSRASGFVSIACAAPATVFASCIDPMRGSNHITLYAFAGSEFVSVMPVPERE